MPLFGENVVVIGAGGHAKVVMSILRAIGLTVAGNYDDDQTKHGSMLGGVRILGSIGSLTSALMSKCVIGIGNNRTRQEVAMRLSQIEWLTIVHPNAYVHKSVRLGPGTVVL